MRYRTSKGALPMEPSGHHRCCRPIRPIPGDSARREPSPRDRRTDAKHKRPSLNRFYGFCVSRLYNAHRPHSTLGYRTPAGFAQESASPSASSERMARLASTPSPAGACGGLDPNLAMRRTNYQKGAAEYYAEMSYNLVDGKRGHVR